MGNNPKKPTARAWLADDQLRFGLILAVIAAVAIGLIVATQRPAFELGQPLRNVEHELQARHRQRQAKALGKTCKRKDCACVEAAARAALDVDAGSLALKLLDAGPACKLAPLSGMRAEALVRLGTRKEGEERAAHLLHERDSDPYALCALGLAAYKDGLWQVATSVLERAVAAGRGDGAELVLGLAHYFRNDLAGARKAFQSVLEHEPEDLDALYNLGLVAQKQDHYGEARRLYLGVLRVDRGHRQARYNLAVLAHSIGAEQEAEHHFKELSATHPDEAMLSALRAELAKPPTKPPHQVLTLGASPGAPPTP